MILTTTNTIEGHAITANKVTVDGEAIMNVNAASRYESRLVSTLK
ncbi:MAG: hypothetical protein AAGI36_15975 [Pseudomonadota bacterium]